MSLVKSKQRVADHGEVFTPAWMVEAMLDLVDCMVAVPGQLFYSTPISPSSIQRTLSMERSEPTA